MLARPVSLAVLVLIAGPVFARLTGMSNFVGILVLLTGRVLLAGPLLLAAGRVLLASQVLLAGPVMLAGPR